MTPSMKKKMEELVIQHNESLRYFENVSFDQVYKNGFTARDEMAEKEIADLSASLKSAVDALELIIETEEFSVNFPVTSPFGKIANKTLTKLKSKHPDLFEGAE